MRFERIACELERWGRDRIKFGTNMGQWAVCQDKDLYGRKEDQYMTFLFFLMPCFILLLVLMFVGWLVEV